MTRSQPINVGEAFSPMRLAADGCDYWVDAWQRSILFWDVMRRRGDVFLEHKAKGKPPVLDFEYETILDGRTFARPVNYALLRMVPPADLPVGENRRPFVIVDPRAGHGPGIGGFKADSQVGVAMRYRHPVYFITFFPKPEPGQILCDVAEAEAMFVEEVIRRHPQADGKPCVIGNCQAGWAVASLAALRPELMGPVILNGAPLSYWAGADGKNPMRYAGGLLGGTWLASLAGDLGDGLFDGAHLVANFENLNPANTLWSKPYNLFANIDTEADRFLEFEKWWGAFYLMNSEEMEAIVSDLFIGNRLARGDAVTRDGERIDLRNIRSPIVVFASEGDNITPPQQALNWIADVYGHEDAIVEQGQVIVYMVHESIGHLGIFVSGRVARKEHTELISTLDLIDRLPPGLYEMVIERKRADLPYAQLEPGDYSVRFELRTIGDIMAFDDGRRDEECFQTVAKLSEINDSLYKMGLRPWVRAISTEWSARQMRHLHPLRMQRYLCSSRNPTLAALPAAAEAVKATRATAAEDNIWLRWQETTSQVVVDGFNAFREIRDSWYETVFNLAYGEHGLGAVFPPRRSPPIAQPRRGSAPRRHEMPDAVFEAGGPLAAVMRMMVAALQERGHIERRSMLLARRLRRQSKYKDVTGREMRSIIKQQANLLRIDEDRALSALCKMLPSSDVRRRAVEIVREVLHAGEAHPQTESPLLTRVARLLEVDNIANPTVAAPKSK